MKKNDNALLIGIGLVAAYFVFIKPKTATPVTVVPAPGSGLPNYAIPTVSPSQGLLSQAGNALTNLVNNLTGNVPNPNNQIPVTVTPAPVVANYPPVQLPSNIPSVIPVYTPTPAPVPVPDYTYQTPVLSTPIASNPSDYTVTYSTPSGGITAADYLGTQTNAQGVTTAPATGVIINTNDALYQMFQHGNYPGSHNGAMSGLSNWEKEFITS